MNRIAASVGVASLVLIGSSCGKISEKVTEKATEKVTEQALGDGAEVDIDADGGVVVKDKDGNEFAAGTKSKLPDDWPREAALPKGFTVVSVISNKTDGVMTRQVTSTGEGDAEELYADMKAQAEDAGFDIESDSESMQGDGYYGSMTAKGPEFGIVVIIMGGEDGEVTLTVSVADNPVDE